jgi:hypothetical protein
MIKLQAPDLKMVRRRYDTEIYQMQGGISQMQGGKIVLVLVRGIPNGPMGPLRECLHPVVLYTSILSPTLSPYRCESPVQLCVFWILPKEINANRSDFCDSHWLEIGKNHLWDRMEEARLRNQVPCESPEPENKIGIRSLTVPISKQGRRPCTWLLLSWPLMPLVCTNGEPIP